MYWALLLACPERERIASHIGVRNCYKCGFFMPKLLILSSDTGEGHNSAASAILVAAQAVGFVTSIRKPLEESGSIVRGLGSFYNVLLTRKPEWMTKYLWVIDRARPNERDLLYSRVRSFIDRFLGSERPDVVLSVHPMLNHFIQRFIREARLSTYCGTFVTDPFPPFWRGWASPYVDRYFVVTDEALSALIQLGIDPGRIVRVQMPVRPQFVPAATQAIEELRSVLKLDDSSTVLINGGARGGGPVFEIYDAVRKSSPVSNVLVICGRNIALRSRIERLRDAKTRTFGFVTDIHRYVGAADLVLTKPGAMSTYEALACGVPVLLLGICALMPQESGMFGAAGRYGFGFAASTLSDLVTIIRRGRSEWNGKREALASFYQASFGEDIIERLQPAHVRA
jgi:UDP-N-acetylglucosamine:LPS N-acetylglucosamine transferase